MTEFDLFSQLNEHFTSVARELSHQASQAGLLHNSTGIGTEREEVYKKFLERHVPRMCDVFLGGYVFDLQGNPSKQIDVIITGSNVPRFRLPSGERHITPLEGTIAVAEIKSRLDKDTLQEALDNCASIPAMPDSKGIVSPILNIKRDDWDNLPFKIVFAYDGVEANTLLGHISEYYQGNQAIPLARRPDVIHVLNKYLIARITANARIESDGPIAHPHDVGKYHLFQIGSDAIAMSFALNALYRDAFRSNYFFQDYGSLHNGIVDRLRREPR